MVIIFSGRYAIGDTMIAKNGVTDASSVTIAPKNIAIGMIGSMSMFAGIPMMDISPIAYAR